MNSVRLNKFLAAAGISSRRHADSLINAGKITVNNLPARLGDKIDPAKDIVKFGNQEVKPGPGKHYYLLHKPVGVLSASSDDRHRSTVVGLINSPVRLFPVGRLDKDTTGLIILTNDGDFALKLTHPRYHLPKTYLVTVKGRLPASKLSRLNHPFLLETGPTQPAQATIVSRQPDTTTLKIILHEGKNRQIRRMLSACRLHLQALQRISIGPLSLGNLLPGHFRPLTPKEVCLLLQLCSNINHDTAKR
ncbi:MAG: pseudouridine synthase [Candidatus Shapirobacteria bacterium]|jgi:pseudouridine synthase